MTRPPKHPDPTPEQIQRKCEAIRRTWTPDERYRRGRWMAPQPVDIERRVLVDLEGE